MPVVDFRPRNPVKQRAGLIGARKRWGEPRIVRLDQLTPPQRALVLALIGAAKTLNEEATPANGAPGAAQNEETATVIETPAAVESDGAGHARPTG